MRRNRPAAPVGLAPDGREHLRRERVRGVRRKAHPHGRRGGQVFGLSHRLAEPRLAGPAEPKDLQENGPPHAIAAQGIVEPPVVREVGPGHGAGGGALGGPGLDGPPHRRLGPDHPPRRQPRDPPREILRRPELAPHVRERRGACGRSPGPAAGRSRAGARRCRSGQRAAGPRATGRCGRCGRRRPPTAPSATGGPRAGTSHRARMMWAMVQSGRRGDRLTVVRLYIRR